jgi:hypothetical protein
MTTPKTAVVLGADLVQRALLGCALPEDLQTSFAGKLEEVGEADVAFVSQTVELTASQACRELRQRMAVVLCDDRYTDADLGEREASSCGAGAFVGPPYDRESLTRAIQAALEPAGTASTDERAAAGGGDPEASQRDAQSPERVWEAFRARVDTIYRNLDRLDHYQVLEISSQSSAQQIKLAYQMRVMEFHPDRFASHPNEDFRRKLYEITKAVTEALRVLGDAAQRNAYDVERRPRERPGRAPRPPKKE